MRIVMIIAFCLLLLDGCVKPPPPDPQRSFPKVSLETVTNRAIAECVRSGLEIFSQSENQISCGADVPVLASGLVALALGGPTDGEPQFLVKIILYEDGSGNVVAVGSSYFQGNVNGNLVVNKAYPDNDFVSATKFIGNM